MIRSVFSLKLMLNESTWWFLCVFKWVFSLLNRLFIIKMAYEILVVDPLVRLKSTKTLTFLRTQFIGWLTENGKYSTKKSNQTICDNDI